MTFKVITVGCKLNQYYSQLIRESLLRAGFSEAEEPALFIINACSVTHKAERDVRKKARALSRRGRVIITGCATDALKAEFEFLSYEELLRKLGAEPARWVRGLRGRHRAYLRVQTGCGFRCSYCIVPLLRGPSQVRALEEIVAEAKALEEAGYREVVLVGAQIGDARLERLLPALLKATSRVRFRLSSLEALFLTEELFDVIESAGWRVCQHFHVPLQSASDKVLRDMARPYSFSFYEERVLALKERFPDAGLGTDILAGFPTESEEDFLKTLEALEKLPFTRAHVFEFSPRPGTPAARLKPLPPQITKERVRALIKVARRKEVEFVQSLVGKRHLVLSEGKVGTAGNFVRVEASFPKEGELFWVEAAEALEARLRGRVLGPLKE